MRNVVISFTVVFCLLLTILSCCSVSFLSEVPITESKAVENAVSISLSKNIDKDITDEELMAEFMNYYLKETANKGSSDIRFHQVDAENGLLDVEVIKTYYWMGVKKEVNTRKVAYIEKVKKDKTVDISDGDSYIGTTEFATLKITINGQVGYCLQENLSHPSKNGTKYYLSDEVVADENLIKIGYLTTIKSYKTTSVQYAIWSVVENDNYVECARSLFGDEVANETAEILELKDSVDINDCKDLKINVFKPIKEGYQDVLTINFDDTVKKAKWNTGESFDSKETYIPRVRFLNEEVIKEIKNIKDSSVAKIDDFSYKITSDYKNLVLAVNDEKAYGVDASLLYPHAESEYALNSSFVFSDELKRAGAAIVALDDGSAMFRQASQIAVWKTLDASFDTSVYNAFIQSYLREIEEYAESASASSVSGLCLSCSDDLYQDVIVFNPSENLSEAKRTVLEAKKEGSFDFFVDKRDNVLYDYPTDAGLAAVLVENDASAYDVYMVSDWFYGAQYDTLINCFTKDIQERWLFHEADIKEVKASSMKSYDEFFENGNKVFYQITKEG